MPSAFISYSHSDSNFVDRLAGDLKAREITVWIDKWNMKPGDSLAGRAADGIRMSDFFIAVLSCASINSRWVKEELDMALVKNIEDKKGTIISILIEECEIPLQLRTRKYIDFRQNQEQAFEELLQAIRPQTDHPQVIRPQTSETATPEVSAMQMSRLVQSALKRRVLDSFLRDQSHLKTIGSMGPLIVYAALPPTTSIRLDGDRLYLNTDRDVYWDWVDRDLRAALAGCSLTLRNLSPILEQVRDRLGSDPAAAFYDSSRIAQFILDATRSSFERTLLEDLLYVESHAVQVVSGLSAEMSRFLAAGKKSELFKILLDLEAKIAKRSQDSAVKSVYAAVDFRDLLLEITKAFD
jgi:TIR domain